MYTVAAKEKAVEQRRDCMSILKVSDVYKSFGKHEVLKGVSLEIEDAGIRALVGPNGSGKTTLFNVISNLLRADTGTVEVVGMKNDNPDIFKEAVFLKDNRVLYEYMSGLDHLSFIRHVQKLPKTRIDEVVERIQIEKYVKQKVGTYSLGMKQHLLLAMAMMNNPKLMILDEPLNGLDPTSVIKVRLLLKELASQGTAVLISSHTLSEIDLLTDHILFLKDGQIVEERMSGEGLKEYEFVLADEESVKKARKMFEGDGKISIRDGVLNANLEHQDLQEFIQRLFAAGISFQDLRKKRLRAEDRYMAMFPEEMASIRLVEEQVS